MQKQLKHRSKSEIITSILKVSSGNVTTITEIQYKTYLSYKLLKEYLAMLVQSDLIEYVKEEKTFRITEKGTHALEVYNKMDELLVLKATTDGSAEIAGANASTLW